MNRIANSYGLIFPPAACANVTQNVDTCRAESRIQEGLLMNALHIAASVFIHDDEGDCTIITICG